MSDTLRKFLEGWLAWVDAGAPNADHKSDQFYYRNDSGLCWNLTCFAWHVARDNNKVHPERLSQELQRMFRDDGLKTDYPFNTDAAHYNEDKFEHNPARVAWVRSKVDKFSLDGAIKELESGAKLHPLIDFGPPVGEEFGAK